MIVPRLPPTSWALLVASLLLVAASALGATYRVPSQVPTIQGAVNLTQPGDSVLVAAGTYFENLTMRNGVILVGESGATATTVDGRFLGPVVNASSVTGFTVQGLTLRRGYTGAYPGGAGIAMNLSQGTVLDCVLADNHSERDGGGISIVDSQATIRRCTFRNNNAGVSFFLDGGGVFCYRSTMRLEDCVILDNLAHEGGGIAVANSSSAIVRRCVVARNEATSDGLAGGGYAMAASTATIENNTFVNNVTLFSSACVFFVSSAVSFQRNIIANSTGMGLSCQNNTATCNDVWNSANTNYSGCPAHPSNLSADPLFCNLAALDLRLDQASPCAPANSPAGCGLIGALDVGCGPVAVEPTTWGRIKARFNDALTPEGGGRGARR